LATALSAVTLRCFLVGALAIAWSLEVQPLGAALFGQTIETLGLWASAPGSPLPGSPLPGVAATTVIWRVSWAEELPLQ
jgi:hypothetical protein